MRDEDRPIVRLLDFPSAFLPSFKEFVIYTVGSRDSLLFLFYGAVSSRLSDKAWCCLGRSADWGTLLQQAEVGPIEGRHVVHDAFGSAN